MNMSLFYGECDKYDGRWAGAVSCREERHVTIATWCKHFKRPVGSTDSHNVQRSYACVTFSTRTQLEEKHGWMIVNKIVDILCSIHVDNSCETGRCRKLITTMFTSKFMCCWGCTHLSEVKLFVTIVQCKNVALCILFNVIDLSDRPIQFVRSLNIPLTWVDIISIVDRLEFTIEL